MLYDCPCQTQTATSFATGLQADMACLLTIYLRDSLSPKVDLSHSRGLVSGLLCGTMPGNLPVPLFLSRSPNLLSVLKISSTILALHMYRVRTNCNLCQHFWPLHVIDAMTVSGACYLARGNISFDGRRCFLSLFRLVLSPS